MLMESGGVSLAIWTIMVIPYNDFSSNHHVVKDADNQLDIPILRIEPTVSTTIVGVEQALDGSIKGQLAVLTSVVDH